MLSKELQRISTGGGGILDILRKAEPKVNFTYVEAQPYKVHFPRETTPQITYEPCTFRSKVQRVGSIRRFPEFKGMRVMMMPIDFKDFYYETEDADDPTVVRLPDFMKPYQPIITELVHLSGIYHGIGFITIDEKILKMGESHRRPGLHVDGVYRKGMGESAGSWGGGGGGGSWGGGAPIPRPGGAWGGGGGGGVWSGRGMLLVSSYSGCRAWDQVFAGRPGDEGECEHLRNQLCDECVVDLIPHTVYWLNPLCVHESLPMNAISTQRQLVRLSFPSVAPWFEGYTENPCGIKPAGPILPARTEFMEQ